MSNYLEKLYDDVFPNTAGQICSHCGYFGKAKEMTFDEDLGWIHWSCLKRYQRMEKEEQRFEHTMNQIRTKNGGVK